LVELHTKTVESDKTQFRESKFTMQASVSGNSWLSTMVFTLCVAPTHYRSFVPKNLKYWYVEIRVLTCAIWKSTRHTRCVQLL